MVRASVAVAVGAVVAACVMGSVGCSSGSTSADECVGEGAAALRTCAKGATLKGVDVSVYQGTVAWSQVKTSGRTFAFVRVSDGLSHPDTKFAQNWPGTKAAGLVRGVYQFFRPGQDPVQQADMLLSKLSAAGGLAPGDLPPVLDLETTDGESSSVVVSRAKAWLSHVEKAIGVKPIVYTANFMSATIGSGFGAYTLWVANYGASCPLMPSGWTDWHFWQDADNGAVPGISGNVDTDLFNGTRAQLDTLTIQPAAGGSTGSGSGSGGAGSIDKLDHVVPGDAIPFDGSEGATLGSGAPPTTETTAAPLDPCAR